MHLRTAKHGHPHGHPHTSPRQASQLPLAAGRPQFLAKEVRLSRRLCSADRLNTPWTNYVGTYTGALDYVFHEPGRVAVRREVALPPEEALQGFIPSSAFPSDHLAVSSSRQLHLGLAGWLPAGLTCGLRPRGQGGCLAQAVIERLAGLGASRQRGMQ